MSKKGIGKLLQTNEIHKNLKNSDRKNNFPQKNNNKIGILLFIKWNNQRQ